MIRAYQNIRRRFSINKHQKLLEDNCQDPVNDGVTFYVRYLGCCSVPRPSGEEVTAEAIKNIIQAARKDNRRLIRVAMLISVRGIKMSDLETTKTLLNFSIYRISYCSADATFTHVFAFIAVNRAECLQCHAFLARKQKIAQAATLTIAQAFNLAFDKWKQEQFIAFSNLDKLNQPFVIFIAQSRCQAETKEEMERRKREEKKRSQGQGCQDDRSQITSSSAISEKHSDSSSKNTDGCVVPKQTEPSADIFSLMDEDVLLIDLRSPDQNVQICFAQCSEQGTRPSISSISAICQTQSSPHPSSFSSPPSPSGLPPCLSPTPSPLHGACLTPRKLMTPANTPLPNVRKFQPSKVQQSPLAKDQRLLL